MEVLSFWNQYALFILYFPNYTTLFLSHTETHSHLILHVWNIYKHTNAHMLACPQFLYTHKLYYSDSDTPLCWIHIYIHTYITLLWHTFTCIHKYIHMCINHPTAQFVLTTYSHMHHITLCHKPTHTPYITTTVYVIYSHTLHTGIYTY